MMKKILFLALAFGMSLTGLAQFHKGNIPGAKVE